MPVQPRRKPPRAGASASRSARQVNVRVEPALYRALEAVARDARRSVPQTALRLIEAGLSNADSPPDDGLSGHNLAHLVARAGAFDWLEDEPDLYDDDSGEPL